LKVSKTLVKDCLKGLLKSVVASKFFCFTNKNKGIENINHQIATVKKEYKIPSICEFKLKIDGYKYIETFIKNRIPPPKYPSAYPKEET
jgi:hypothetical protein